MRIALFNEQQDLLIAPASVRAVVRAVLAFEKRKTDDVAVHFVSEEKIAQLHGEFFNDPTPTDCISFPLDEESSFGRHVLGEVVICPAAAIKYAGKESAYLETTLYLVHALLHLLGYDDIDPRERRKMRAAEKKHMVHLISSQSLLLPQ